MVFAVLLSLQCWSCLPQIESWKTQVPRKSSYDLLCNGGRSYIQLGKKNKKQESLLLEELRAEPRTLIANKGGDSRLRTSYDYIYICICIYVILPLSLAGWLDASARFQVKLWGSDSRFQLSPLAGF